MVGRIGNPSYGENHSAGRHSPRSAPKRGGLEGRRSAAQGATLGSALSPPEAPRLCGLKGHRNPAQTSILREAPLAGYAVALESEGQARGTRFHPGLGSVGPSGRGTRGPVSQGFTLGWVPSVLQARGTCRPLSQGFTLGWVPSALQAEAHVARHPRVSPWAGFRRPFRPRHTWSALMRRARSLDILGRGPKSSRGARQKMDGWGRPNMQPEARMLSPP